MRRAGRLRARSGEVVLLPHAPNPATVAHQAKPIVAHQVSPGTALPHGAPQSLAFTMVGKKVNNCDKWVDDKHADYPPSFCFIGNPFIKGGIDNHPYFKSEKR
jgi:hypothetical protein